MLESCLASCRLKIDSLEQTQLLNASGTLGKIGSKYKNNLASKSSMSSATCNIFDTTRAPDVQKWSLEVTRATQLGYTDNAELNR